MRKAIGKRQRVIKAAWSALHFPSRRRPEASWNEDARRIRRVIVETERTFIFRSRSSVCNQWCGECGADVQMAGVDVVARESGVSELSIYQLIESRVLHFMEAGDGHLLVCLNSLNSLPQ